MTVIGIDISKWDGNWDAPKAKAAGAEYVFIKSSQACFVDQRFAANWKKAREAGIIRSAYHYLDYTRPGREQATFFADLLSDDPGDLPPVIDFEQTRPDNNTTLARSFLKDFMDELTKHNYTPMIYTSPGFWKTYGDNSNYWYQFPLWIANYISAAAPIVPAPWLNWNFWQFSKKGPGALFGSEALEMDMNRFNGTLEELNVFARRKPGNDLQARLTALETRVASLEKLLNQTPPKPEDPPAPDPTPLPKATVIKARAAYYESPFNSIPPQGSLELDQVVEILETLPGWVRIKAPAGWVELSSLKLDGAQVDPGNPPAAEYAICRANALNVRNGPNVSYPVVGWIQLGQRVKVLDRKNNWCQLESPAGWSQASYLTPA